MSNFERGQKVATTLQGHEFVGYFSHVARNLQEPYREMAFIAEFPEDLDPGVSYGGVGPGPCVKVRLEHVRAVPPDEPQEFGARYFRDNVLWLRVGQPGDAFPWVSERGLWDTWQGIHKC